MTIQMKKALKILLALVLAYFMPVIFGDKTKNILDMFLLLVSIIIPFQITTYSLIVGIIDADSLISIKKINPPALEALSGLFDEFSSDTRLIILFGVLYFVSTFVAKENFYGINAFEVRIIYGVAFFSVFSIFAIVIESINVILQVGKSKIDIARKLKDEK